MCVKWTAALLVLLLSLAAGAGEADSPDCGSAAYAVETLETWVQGPGGIGLYTRILQPAHAVYPDQEFPALITIPGGTGNGAPLADSPVYEDISAAGFVVVAFNLPGRGSGHPGDLLSGGQQDCNGYADQDALKALVEHVAALPNVDKWNIGVETSSFGIAVGAGALGRYPDLPVAYLVDLEGPHDSRCTTFYDAGEEKPVCGHLSTVTDPSEENQAWWAEREAVRHIGTYPGMYMRVQAEVDHAQGPGYFRHAVEMINAATRPEFGGAGSARWTRVNGEDVGNPVNATCDLGDPSKTPTWLAGRLHQDHPGLNAAYDGEMASLAEDSPPACSVVAPAGGALVSCDVVVAASAEDDQGIARVDFLVDGQPAGTAPSAPFELRWDSRQAANGSHLVTARAFDTVGQSTLSEAVSVSVANPVVKTASCAASQRTIQVQGEGFDNGCTALIDRQAAQTVWKSAGLLKVKGVAWKRGQAVTVEVLNPDGCQSLAASFTRP